MSDDMNAMERALHLNTLQDELTVSIASKIQDDKDKMLVLLLYKVCNNMDSTRMTFIRFAIMLHQHGILNDLNFLMENPVAPPVSDQFDDTNSSVHLEQGLIDLPEDQFSDAWSDEEHSKSEATSHTDSEHIP